MQHPVCPHCGEPLSAFELPQDAGWEGESQLACFNDDCPYYVRGWQHMEEQYAVKASYRYRFNPATGRSSPLAVWSSDAIKDRIIAADDPGPEADAPEEGDNEEGSLDE